MNLKDLQNTYIQLHHKADSQEGTIGSVMPTGVMKADRYISLYQLYENLNQDRIDYLEYEKEMKGG